MFTNTITTVALFSGLVAALPKPQAGQPVCTSSTSYQNLSQDPPYDLAPEIVTGYRCTSNLADGCTITSSATHTVTVGTSVNGGAGGGLDLGKIFSLGLDAGFTYSWSTSDAKGVSASVTCPKGGMECGIQVIPKVVKNKGQTRTVTTGFSCGSGGADWSDFEIVAPYEIGNSDSGDIRAVMDFSACMTDCSGDACAAAEAAALPKCP